MLIRFENLSAELMLIGKSNIQGLRLMFIFVDQIYLSTVRRPAIYRMDELQSTLRDILYKLRLNSFVIVKQLRHTFRHKLLGKEQRKLLKQLRNQHIPSPDNKILAYSNK